jgi:hypothetical protein
MLLTDSQKDLMTKRIQPIVSFLMEEEPLFREDLDYESIVQELTQVFEENLSFEEFNTLSDTELKKRCSAIMSTELLSSIGKEWTPEQMAIFDDAVRRK